MPQPIRDEGSPRARLVLVGEAGGQHEAAQGRPFVGPSGQMLARWWRDAGLARDHFFITNVVQRQPPKNNINAVPADEMQRCVSELHDKIAALDDPWLIVPTGNTALRALARLSGITKHRGSIYEITDRRGRQIKCIPTLHPASIFRQPSWERRCIVDWQRIAADATFRELRLPEREHFIEPTFGDLEDYVADAESRAEVLSIDIETPRRIELVNVVDKRGKTRVKRIKGAPRVTVVGFSFEPHFSFTVPTTPEYWSAQGVKVEDAWTLLRRLCALPGVEKGGQNFLFDAWWLAREHDCPVTEMVYDTRWMSHCLDVLDEHSLGYQASIHLRAQFWKDDSKDDDKDSDTFVASGVEAMRTYWRYNGKDAAHTRELMGVHDTRLAAAGRTGHYLSRYAALYPVMLAMSLGGIRTDQRAVRKHSARFLAERIALQDRLDTLAGAPLFGPKGSLVPKRLNTYLYETLRLPVAKDRKTGRAASNEIIVRRLMLRHPAKLAEAGPAILANRRLEALSRFVKEGIADDDGYTRCSWGFTYTMRFKSGKAANRLGTNLQNTDRELLSMYIPDPGHILVEVDESQAEDRVVKMLAGALVGTSRDRQRQLFERARAMPWENDEHKRAAVLIFHTTTDAVTKDQRYLAKRARHASNYGMHGKTLSEQLLKDGHVYSPEDCDGFISAVLDRDVPEVRDWQRSVRQTVLRDKALTNSWGHRVDFRYERLGDDLYREAYAVIPQSEVTSIVKYWGLVPLHALLSAERWDARILLEKHDSILVSTHPRHAWDIYTFLRERLERPRRYGGHELTIPIELKLGRDAAMQREFKKPPTREEFEAAVEGLR